MRAGHMANATHVNEGEDKQASLYVADENLDVTAFIGGGFDLIWKHLSEVQLIQ